MDRPVPLEINYYRLVSVVLWPAFLMACMSSGLVFSLIDPSDLQSFDARFMVSSQALYTLGFLMFWLLGCVASGMTALLLMKTR